MTIDPAPILLTLRLACVTTLVLLIIGLPLAYWLAFSNSRRMVILEALVSMPLVLPPTVLGFYLLIGLGPQSWAGGLIESVFDWRIVFSFTGLVIGSVIFSLPFMVNPLKSGFQQLPSSIIEASYTLGKSKGETLLKVMLPNMKPAVLTGIIMSFAHTIGEFGVVLMIGGNIPDRTRLASIAVYSEVEALRYTQAHQYSLVLVVLSFTILFVLYFVNRRTVKVWG